MARPQRKIITIINIYSERENVSQYVKELLAISTELQSDFFSNLYYNALYEYKSSSTCLCFTEIVSSQKEEQLSVSGPHKRAPAPTKTRPDSLIPPMSVVFICTVL
jgi:hypothetical protein